MADRPPYAEQCAARCDEAAAYENPAFDALHPCSARAPEMNADEQTAELARIVALADELLAQEADELARAKAVATELEAREASAMAVRQPSLPEAAEQIARLAGAFDAVLPEAAELIRWLATDARLTHAEGQRLTPKRRERYERALARRRADHRRALDAARLTPDAPDGGERAELLAIHLREAARPLAWLREAPEHSPAEKRDAKVQALAYARQLTAVAKLADAELLGVLYRFALPRQHQLDTGGLSAGKEAALVREILGHDVANSGDGLRKQMDRARKARKERYQPEDTTCPERTRSGGHIIDACSSLPQRDSAKPSDTESSDTASRELPRRLASRRPR